MDPPTTPQPISRARNSSLTPVSATPGESPRASHSNTPHYTHNPFPTRTPRAPGSTARNACTVDESLYARVSVHTAKCTECDKRNMDTMRRCPGCTFQVCQPCYQKREREGKGLVHGNMPTPGETGGAPPHGTGARAVRKKPVANMLYAKSPQKPIDEVEQKQKQCTGSSVMEEKELSVFVPRSRTRKRPVRKSCIDESEPEESSDEFEPDHASPTSGKRRRTLLSFAESALATAVRAPPATRAARRVDTETIYQAPPSAPPEPAVLQSPVAHVPDEHVRDDMLYQQAIHGYDEPLLGRREPVMCNPIARIPAIIRRGGQPRPSAQDIYNSIQDKLPERLYKLKDLDLVPDAAITSMAARNKAEEDGQACTVRAYIEKEARRYQNSIILDEDENKALFHTMQSAALIWGKQTYRKLDPAIQHVLHPGLNLRLDRIDSAYMTELEALMAELAARTLQELGGLDALRFVCLPGPSM